ncbi:extracellular solute-binding protein [Georgenia sp. AZ-5]|uniref:extracellular solute-binding protein n=1 Tax=Georgenia sp. AZ-5 TaxID=3367526 RepID=UPI003754751E
MSVRTELGRVAAGVVAAAVLLGACAARTTEPDDSAGATVPSAVTTVTFRLWDEEAARAYEESFDALSAQFPDVRVRVELVERADYAARAAEDLAAGTMADLFWADPALFPAHADAGALLEAGTVVGEDHDGWEPAVEELFVRDGTLWGVPQVWHSLALYYRTDLAGAAGVAPETLTWAPGGGDGDTLVAAARGLSTDAAGRRPGDEGFDPATQTYGFNAGPDLAAVVGPFLGQNGAALVREGRFAFATEEGRAAVQYLVDLARVHQVAPPDLSPEAALALFTGGRLALLQAGSANLEAVADSGVAWALAPVVAGPHGRPGAVTAVAAVARADTKHPGATATVLRWLASADGQAALASQGVGIPAAQDAQATFVEHWAGRGVEVGVLLDAADEPQLPLPSGPGAAAGLEAFGPVLDRVFRGELPVPEGLQQAQDAANAAVAGPRPEEQPASRTGAFIRHPPAITRR